MRSIFGSVGGLIAMGGLRVRINAFLVCFKRVRGIVLSRPSTDPKKMCRDETERASANSVAKIGSC